MKRPGALEPTRNSLTVQSAVSTPRQQAVLGRVVNRKIFQRGRQEGNIKLSYDWDDKNALGSGSFGQVYRARSLHDSKRVVAVKQINKNACEDLDELWKEIGILEEIDHPHTLRFLEAFEDFRFVYIVTELCSGGDLLKFLERIIGDVGFASRMSAEVLNALAFCHGRGICHRDLKLDNILLLRPSRDSPVRVADFGLASQLQETKCREQVKHTHQYAMRVKAQKASSGETVQGLDVPKRRSQRLTTFAGTPEYMAPEVLSVLNAKVNGTGETAFYDFRCDVWSLGVVVFAVLIGREPYMLEDVAQYVENNTPLPARKEVETENGQDFIARCLNPKYEDRPNSKELLSSPFLRDWEGEKSTRSNSLLDVSDNVESFMSMSHLKRAALTACARHLAPFEQEQLRQTFAQIDTDNTGTITIHELRDALDGTVTDQDWVIRAFAAMDTDLSGEVEYSEFLAAAMDSRIESRRDLAWAAFRAFDIDGNGTISRSELHTVLEDADLKKLLEEVRKESATMSATKTDEYAADWAPVGSDGCPMPMTTPTFSKLANQSFLSRGVDKIMELADTDRDGDISFEEFLVLLELG